MFPNRPTPATSPAVGGLISLLQRKGFSQPCFYAFMQINQEKLYGTLLFLTSWGFRST